MTGSSLKAFMTSWSEPKMRVRVPVTLIISFILTLAVSGLVPIRKAVRPYAPLDEFTAHLDERIPALMKLYRIPGSCYAIPRVCPWGMCLPFALPMKKCPRLKKSSQKKPCFSENPAAPSPIQIQVITCWSCSLKKPCISILS